MKNFGETDNDDEIIGTILSRREAIAAAAKAGFGLMFIGGAGGALGAIRQAPKSVHLVASPALEEGPFFVDEKLNRSNLLTGTTRTSVVQGLPLTLSFTIHKLQNGVMSPLKGAHVDIWHTDAAGVYSDESSPANHEDTGHQTWLRGYQVTDAKGRAKFQTIFPGWYQSRTTHVHIKIRKFSQADKVTAEFTSQLFFDDAVADSVFTKPPYDGRGKRRVYNHDDHVFSQRQVDGTTAGSHLMLKLEHDKLGHSASFAVALTADNFMASF